MGMVCRTATFYAYGMNFLDVLRYRHECRHGTERLAHEISVEAGDDYSDSSVCKCLNNIYESVIEELCFIDSDYFYVA